MEEIDIGKLTKLLDQRFRITLILKVRQRICNDPLGEFIVIEKNEKATLSSYSRNEDGSLCFQVDFDKISAFYYHEKRNSYDRPFYVPEKGAPEEFQDLFYIEGKEQMWRLLR